MWSILFTNRIIKFAKTSNAIKPNVVVAHSQFIRVTSLQQCVVICFNVMAHIEGCCYLHVKAERWLSSFIRIESQSIWKNIRFDMSRLVIDFMFFCNGLKQSWTRYIYAGLFRLRWVLSIWFSNNLLKASASLRSSQPTTLYHQRQDGKPNLHVTEQNLPHKL